MKKVIIFNIVALFVASVAFAGNDSAANTVTFGTSPVTGQSLYGSSGSISVTAGVPAAGTILIGKNSTGVGSGWNTDPLGYAIWTQHQSGTKSFGTCFDSTSIYQADAAKGTAKDGEANKTDSSAFPTSANWTTM